MIFLAGFAAGALCAAAVAAWVRLRKRSELGRLLSFAAHELNTPLTAINMTVLNIASGVFGEVPKEQLQWLEMTREQIGRLNGIVGELRDFVHLALQRDIALRIEEVDPAEAVETALKAVKMGCDHAKIPLVSEVPASLPKVRADLDRLTRSLATLVFHARKFRASGPIRVSARVADDLAFEVAFQGSKLSRAEAARSLDLLYPGRPRTSRGMTATGMGLGIVRALARSQGGELELDVADDGGQVLRLHAPLAGKVLR